MITVKYFRIFRYNPSTCNYECILSVNVVEGQHLVWNFLRVLQKSLQADITNAASSFSQNQVPETRDNVNPFSEKPIIFFCLPKTVWAKFQHDALVLRVNSHYTKQFSYASFNLQEFSHPCELSENALLNFSSLDCVVDLQLRV